MEDVMAETLEGPRSTHLSASTDCWQVRKPAATTLCGEIERHRAALGSAVRQAIDEIQDAENCVTSTLEKSAEHRRLDQRSPNGGPIAPTRNRAPGPRLRRERLARRKMHFDMA